MRRPIGMIRCAALLILLSFLGCSEKPAPPPPPNPAPAPPVPSLSGTDVALLDHLFQDGLFDPIEARATRIQGTMSLPDCFGKMDSRKAPGWLVPESEGRPRRVVLDNLQETAVPETWESVDFAAESLKLAEASGDPEFKTRYGIFGGYPHPIHPAVRAAWLHRCGKDSAAAIFLRKALTNAPYDRIFEDFGKYLSWMLFDQTVNAFRARRDALALSSAERLVRVNSSYLVQATLLLADFRRRQKAGTFGKPVPALPDDFPGWPVEKRVSRLIERLDEVDAPQRGSPGHIELDHDPRFIDLCAAGEVAVPALIECVGKDTRLVRSFSYFRSYQQSRDSWQVRQIAYNALQVILKTQFISPFVSRPTVDPDSDVKGAVALAGAYWKKHGSTPFPTRMLMILADEKALPFFWQEAAENLAHLDEQRSFMMETWLPRGSRRSPGIHPGLLVFEKPTAAEAVLAAFDRHVALFVVRGKEVAFYGLERLEDDYLRAVAGMSDARIIPELRRRIPGATSTGLRRKLSFCIHELGDRGPIDDFARDFAKGRITLPANDRQEVAGNNQGAWQPGNMELRSIVGDLARSGTAAAQAALEALTRPDHPCYPIAAERLRYCWTRWSEDGDWFRHPYCLKILRRELDKKNPVGVSLSIEGTRMAWSTGNSSGEKEIPEFLRNPNLRNDRGEERWCDGVAEQLNTLVLGLPEYHPLMKTAEETLAEMARILDRFEGRFRTLTSAEVEALGRDRYSVHYVPDLRPVRVKATEKDVAQGKAIFFVRGPTTPAAVPLPSIASVKVAQGAVAPPAIQFGRIAASMNVHPGRILILQAERLPDNSIHFGGIGPFGIGSFAEKDLEDLVPLIEQK